MLDRPYRFKWKFFKSIDYTPRSGQKLLHWAADYWRYLGFYAYPRGGKSYGSAMEVAATLNEPDYHCWIVAPTYDLGSKEFGYIYNAHRDAGYLQKAKTVLFNVRGGEMRIEYPWGWFVEVKSAERPQLILAEELDELILSEAARLPESIWHRSLFNRAEKRRGRVYIPTTPAGHNWIRKEFWDRAQKFDAQGNRNKDYDSEYWALRVSHLIEEKSQPSVHYQGGVYSEDTIDRARRQMEPQLFREQFGGDFVSYAGTVYPGNRIKRIQAFEIPKEWHLVIGYDHGASGRKGGNTAITFVAYDNERPRNAYLTQLVYTSGHGAKWYAQEIKNRLGQHPYDIVVVDPSAKQVRIELSLAGIANTTPPTRDFKSKYARVMSLIEEGRLYAFDKQELKPFWHEIDRYEWKDNAKKEEPHGDMVTGPDDSLDSLGYALLHNIPDVQDEEFESAAKARGAQNIKLSDTESRYWEGVTKAQEQRRDELQSVVFDEYDESMDFDELFAEE